MSKLNIKTRGSSSLRPIILFDGKEGSVKRNQFGNATHTADISSSYAEIRIYNIITESSPLWFLVSLFFFIISAFGIFDVKENRKCFAIDATIKVKLNGDANLELTYLPLGDGTPALEVNGDCDFTVENNIYRIDEVAKKRRKIMLFVKIALWIGLAVAVVLSVINMIG